MSKYIPADKLIAEIERQQRKLTVLSFHARQLDMKRDCALQNGVYRYILGIITSLQQEQPEVDFETEYAKFSNDPDALDYAFPIDLADYKDFARHFYEFGLNAIKDE